MPLSSPRFGTNGRWMAEGYGVEPDLSVLDAPERVATRQGLQLEAAIRAMKQAMVRGTA